jgi:hypothetical protein
MTKKKWRPFLTIGDVRTYMSADGKIEMTVRPDGDGGEMREFAVMGKPRERFRSEEAARRRLDTRPPSSPDAA